MQKHYGDSGMSSAKGLDQSQHNKGGGEQGEIRIKFTDSAKVSAERDPQPFFREPENKSKPEKIEFKVNFAMAYGSSMNFSMPIYSGTFTFRATF